MSIQSIDLAARRSSPTATAALAVSLATVCMLPAPSAGAGTMDQLHVELPQRAPPTVPLSVGCARQIGRGREHELVVLNDGTVRAWGRNPEGCLGDGTNFYRTLPVSVIGLTGVRSVAGGGWHSLAALEDGSMQSWGSNLYGQLGSPGADTFVPRPIPGIAGVVAVAAGQWHSLALLDDGTVMAWGLNDAGQLGTGNFSGSRVPQAVVGLTGVVAISAGDSFSLALLDDGTLRAWGGNSEGWLGNGGITDSNVPVSVVGLTQVRAISAAGGHSLAVRDDGTVWSWGSNPFGQLGDGTRDNYRSLPVQVSGLSGVSAVAAGDFHSLALMNDGSVRTWGNNEYGELGDDTTVQLSMLPVTVMGLDDVVAISANLHESLALLGDGRVVTFGKNEYGEGGIGVESFINTPATVPGAGGAVSVACGLEYSFAVAPDGSVKGWGRNEVGQLGNGTRQHLNVPAPIPGLTGVASLAAGEWHTIALLVDGTAVGFGDNSGGQLGHGYESSDVPVPVDGLTGLVSVAAGLDHSLGLTSAGTVWAWGSNWYGQLGNGTTFGGGATPAPVVGLSGVVQISSQGNHSLALLDDGTVRAWGSNDDGEIGDGTTNCATLPVPVTGLSSVVAVAAGTHHSLALLRDGTAMAWGRGFMGALGNGSYTTYSTVPVSVLGLTNAVRIAATEDGSLAILQDGTVSSWGGFSQGRNPDSGYTNSNVPLPVAGLSGIVAIAGGRGLYLALGSDGSLFSWGNNLYGELGNGQDGIDQLPVVAELTSACNEFPWCYAGSDRLSCVGEQISLSDATADDPAGGTLTYTWTASCAGAAFSDASILNPTVTFAAPGTCRLTLTVTNATGLIGWSVATVVVADRAPPEVSGPGSPAPLVVTKASPDGDVIRLSFEDFGADLSYNVYAGDIGTWYSHASLACGVTPAQILGRREYLADVPAAKLYFLLTASNHCAEGESGADSRGTPHPAVYLDCPR